MANFSNCVSCRPFEMPGLGSAPPSHCHGSGDRPAPKGVLGGFICSCPCRYRPDELWHMSDAWAKARSAVTASEQAAFRIARYNELMIEAGHVIDAPIDKAADRLRAALAATDKETAVVHATPTTSHGLTRDAIHGSVAAAANKEHVMAGVNAMRPDDETVSKARRIHASVLAGTGSWHNAMRAVLTDFAETWMAAAGAAGSSPATTDDEATCRDALCRCECHTANDERWCNTHGAWKIGNPCIAPEGAA